MSIVKNDKSHMPIYHGNKSIKMINHGENLVYKERIPEGTSLWNEDRVFGNTSGTVFSRLQKYSTYPIIPTGTLTNNFKFSDIRNGIIITTSKLNASYTNTNDYSDEFVFSKSYTSKISREDILSGNSVLVWTGNTFINENYSNVNTGYRNIANNGSQRTLYDIYFQMIDDNNFKLTCTNKSYAVWTNSTEFYGYTGGEALLKIESIIAY